ncbi:MAG: PucR family transcriptional regulator [Arachnia sp.]
MTERSPSVRDVLALEAVTAGHPHLLSGESALDARVRWVHVSDSPRIARLLDGGELLLSTGSGWPADPEHLRSFVNDLIAAGLSGLVLELGTHYRHTPGVLVSAARAGDLPLIALHREVKFVSITEAVHRRIIDEQTAALRARDEVRARFTGLALRGSPPDFIVQQLSHTLAAPVVLENLAHEVVFADVPSHAEQDLLTGWETRSRRAPDDAWTVVPVEARGISWGRLVVLPGPPHRAGREAVVEQAAIALALSRLTDADGDQWVAIGRRHLLNDLLAGRYATKAGAVARIEATGTPVVGAALHGVVVAGAEPSASTVAAAAAELGGGALATGLPEGVTILLSLPVTQRFDDDAARRFAGLISASPERVVVSVGSAGMELDAGLRSVQEALDVARDGAAPAGLGPHVRRAEHRPLSRLVAALHDDHRVLDHRERMLGPLIEHDLTQRGDLLDVLAAMLAHPGNRTAAAAASHLSRSVFYQRLRLIQDLLAVDLEDGELQAALHLALLVHRATGTPTQH